MKTERLTLEQTAAFLLSRDNFLLLSHRRPDGDTVGSNVALCRALRALGKTAWVYDNPQFTPRFASFLEGVVGRPDPRPPQGEGGGEADRFTVVSCDVASRGLLPFGMEEAQVDLAIDHHGANDGFAARTLVNPQAAACGELLTELIALLGVSMDRPMAEALYVAIATDTGCFCYSNVTAATHRAAAACIQAGAEIYPINRSFFEVKRRVRLDLEAWLVAHMEYLAQGKVAVAVLDRATVDRIGVQEDDMDDISGFGRTIEGVEIAVMLREVEDHQGKVSVRTSPAYDAARICARLGGGGHAAAAGATWPGGIYAAKKAVLASIAQEIAL